MDLPYNFMANYCELVLYLGRCPSDGLPEGRFYPDNKDPFSINRIGSAIRIIERYLLPSQNWGLIVDYNNLVKDNAEADKLAEHAKRCFNGSQEIIEPHMCMHGRIIFARKIRFDNCYEKDAGSIIATMKKSGHIPNELTQKAERIRRTNNSEAIIGRHLSELVGKEDDLWRSALKVYSLD